MSNKQIRILLRCLHILAGALTATVIYAPPGFLPFLTTLAQWVIIPFLVLTGLYLWQMPRIMQFLKAQKPQTRHI